jgi:hypothetical protein
MTEVRGASIPFFSRYGRPLSSQRSSYKGDLYITELMLSEWPMPARWPISCRTSGQRTFHSIMSSRITISQNVVGLAALAVSVRPG